LDTMYKFIGLGYRVMSLGTPGPGVGFK
jgi:hypothetical protein